MAFLARGQLEFLQSKKTQTPAELVPVRWLRAGKAAAERLISARLIRKIIGSIAAADNECERLGPYHWGMPGKGGRAQIPCGTEQVVTAAMEIYFFCLIIGYSQKSHGPPPSPPLMVCPVYVKAKTMFLASGGSCKVLLKTMGPP